MAALKAQHHRGPDATNAIYHNGVGIGHNRLSIIDISGSRQPMVSDDQRYSLSYNGEIYNYKKLRLQLKDQWTFKSQGDTEVLLAGLVLQGLKFVNRLDGMFAFILWDRLSDTLIAARDRWGKKPLYYSQNRDNFIIASELPALAKLNDAPWSIDSDSLADFLRYGYYAPGYSMYSEVKELRAGHSLLWTKGIISCQPYWHPSHLNGSAAFSEVKKDESDKNDLQALLSQALEKRMMADVPVGLFLSGGIDSSIIGALASLNKHNISAYSLGFKDAGFDELEYAKRVASHCQLPFFSQVGFIDDETVLRKLLKYHFFQPFGDPSVIPFYSLSFFASKHVKVCIGGDGADELFWGYMRYQGLLIHQMTRTVPRFVFDFFRFFLGRIAGQDMHYSRSWLKKVKLFLDLLENYNSVHYSGPSLSSTIEFNRLFPSLGDRGHMKNFIESIQVKTSNLERCRLIDLLSYLANDILAKVDIGGMANSLEVRSPFLDERVASYAWMKSRVPRINNRKPELYQLANKLLPAGISSRPKQGFQLPIKERILTIPSMFQGSSLQSVTNHEYLRKKMRNINEDRDVGLLSLWPLYVHLVWESL